MRTFIASAVLTVATLTFNVAPASAQPVDVRGVVDGWYVRYLGRHADPLSMSDQLRAIRAGYSLEVLEASVLRTEEYYLRNGGTPEGYVAALYRDVLGRRASPHEFRRKVECVLIHGRNETALRILAERNQPVVVSSAPVVVAQPTVIVPRPVVVLPPPLPHHHHHHHQVHPGLSIRIGIR